MKAQMQITASLLADMLFLPRGSKILDAKMDQSSPFPVIILTVENDDILTDYVHPTYERKCSEDCNEKLIRFISW